ncbi:class I SAM-dependent rRNA methyltransferase [Candidatus Falkowbacteria bacterium]|nr:class I SAM-dependent rRNA methyltransferase [Candidatus Falkowbacteria bacterium]
MKKKEKEELVLIVKNDRVRPILARHPWVFSRAIVNIPDSIESGTSIKLVDEQNNFLARGYFNSYSQIAVRVWSYDEKKEVDASFFVKRIEEAYGLRQNYLNLKETNAFRVVNGENDFLPGLIVDKYADYLVVQFHTRGIEFWQKEIVGALIKVMKPKGIYSRSDMKVREIEGGERKTELLYGAMPDVIVIKENGLKFQVEVKVGQKTGFFLDQRDKRQALSKYVSGRSVLNCFAYTGGFSVYALAAGAKAVTNVDVSEGALAAAKKNVELNKLPVKKCAFVCADVKEYLRNVRSGEFDVIILDPPAFIKNQKSVERGMAGYRALNEAAIRLLPVNGILVTCSCSSHLSLADFRSLLAKAGARCGRSAQILETFTHGLDHPSAPAFIEGDYLKCFIVMVK